MVAGTSGAPLGLPYPLSGDTMAVLSPPLPRMLLISFGEFGALWLGTISLGVICKEKWKPSMT